MKKLALFIILWLGLTGSFISCWGQSSSGEQQTSAEKMAKVRAAKAQKKEDRAAGRRDVDAGRAVKATPTDYQAPVDKVLRGPNGEVVHTGERGGKFYINKNGNKTYLSSNQQMGGLSRISSEVSALSYILVYDTCSLVAG